MIGRTAFIFVMLVLMGACAGREKRPAGILSKEEMISLLVEIYLAEARLSGLAITNDSSYGLYLPFEDSLLRRKGIPDSVIKKTHRYYLAHPQELEAVYDSVIDSLSLREQKAQQGGGK